MALGGGGWVLMLGAGLAHSMAPSVPALGYWVCVLAAGCVSLVAWAPRGAARGALGVLHWAQERREWRAAERRARKEMDRRRAHLSRLGADALRSRLQEASRNQGTDMRSNRRAVAGWRRVLSTKRT